MKPPENLTEVIDGKRYSTHTATLLAGDDYWDGHNFERNGRNEFLYRTPNGSFFSVTVSQWQGASDVLKPLTQGEAIALFENMREKRVIFENAFPGVKVQDA